MTARSRHPESADVAAQACLVVQAQSVAAELEASLAEAQRETQRLADANAALLEELGSLRQKQDCAEDRVGPHTSRLRVSNVHRSHRASMTA